METVTHHGRDTAYRHTQSDADGPSVLYVHGSGGTHNLWVHQYAPTGPSHPAVGMDLSGHGDSEDIDTEAGPETLQAYAEDVGAVAVQTDADILVGNSLGGAVVFEVVFSGTYEPAGLVFAGTGAKLAVHEDLRRLLADDFEAAIERLHEPGLLLGGGDEQAIDQSQKTLRETGQAVTRRDFLTCHEFDVREELGEIAVPALAVVGEDDQLTPPAYHEYLAEQIDTCRFETIPDAGHLAMLEGPGAFNDTLASFVADVSDP